MTTMVTGVADGVEMPPILDDIWTLLVVEWRTNHLAAPLGIKFSQYDKTDVTVTFASSYDLSTWAVHYNQVTRCERRSDDAGWQTQSKFRLHGYRVVLEFNAWDADVAPEQRPTTDDLVDVLSASLPAGWIDVSSGRPVKA